MVPLCVCVCMCVWGGLQGQVHLGLDGWPVDPTGPKLPSIPCHPATAIPPLFSVATPRSEYPAHCHLPQPSSAMLQNFGVCVCVCVCVCA